MTRYVNSFFVTKIAKEKKKTELDEIVDPGEAAAAGIAAASGPVAQALLPSIASYGLMRLGPEPLEHTGIRFRGKTVAEMFDDPRLASSMDLTGRMVKVPTQKEPIPEIGERGRKVLRDLGSETTKILNIFNVRQSPKKWYQTTASPGMAELVRVSDSVDDMIIRNKLPQKGVSLEVTSGPLARFSGPYYDPSGKRVVLPWTNKPFILHELGHAAHLTKPGARTFDAMRQMLHGGTAMAIPMAYLAGNEMKELIPGRLDDKAIDFVQENAPALMAGTYVGASIYPEVQATTRAVSHVYKTEGPKAARKTLKALLPALATYLVPIVPTVVGLSLAKKYFFEAKKKKESQEKKAAFKADWLDDTIKVVKDIAGESAYAFGQMGVQAGELLRRPGAEVAKRLYEAGKANVKSPAFAYGATMAGVPAMTAAFVLHNTPEGRLYAEREREITKKRKGPDPLLEAQLAAEKAEKERNHGSLTFPAIVGMGAAVSGGFLTKFFTDLYRVL